jgi:uncharacterized protein YecE (DUF72 family)
MSPIHIGTSGYSYDDWQGRFYPANLPRDQWLNYYATKFDTVELNVTFYRTPNKKTFEGWSRKTPDEFHFVVKGSRFITHLKRLQGVEESLKIFFDSCLPLQEKLKVVLWQLPPKFPADVDRLQKFLESLASYFARAKNSMVKHAFEFRDRSWLSDETYEILHQHDAALVIADYPFQMAGEDHQPYISQRPQVAVPLTASWVYMRRHGPGGLFSSNYTPRQLTYDSEAIKTWTSRGRDTYVFFNNDAQGFAAANAQTLKRLIQK